MAVKKKETIEDKLNKSLSKKDIKQRQGGGGKMLDYLEGWWVKQNANRIFGIGNWSYEALWETMKHVELPKNRKGKDSGLYTIFVKLTVKIDGKDIVRTDIGSTQYHGADNKEMAIKGSVTDALKRCFASFGEQFGLLLYDKDSPAQKQNVVAPSQAYNPPNQKELMAKYAMDATQVVPKCPTCGEAMRIVERKDKSGIFWSCKNWRTKGCKGYSIDEVDLDGTVTVKGAKSVSKKKSGDITDAEGVEDECPF